MPAEASEPQGVELDLTLFRLPVVEDPTNAEVPLAASPDRRGEIKHDFWSAMARRLDLTGSGSLVTHHPAGTRPTQPLTDFEARLDQLYERLAQHEYAGTMPKETRQRPLNLAEQVSGLMQDVTPQFFLRNIARLERNVNVRRPNYQHAIWTEVLDDYYAFVRAPRFEPIPFVEEISIEAMKRLQRQRRDDVHGFVWEESFDGHFTHPVRIPSSVGQAFPRVPVEELSLEPAPAFRTEWGDQHVDTLRQLGERFDATRKD